MQSTLFETTTNSVGSTITTAPAQITSTFTSTNSDGAATTVTEIIANPTLSNNNDSSSTSQYVFFATISGGETVIESFYDRFFHNKGAVAGVFLIVGLAAASICLFLFFFIRRRRRRRRIDHDTAVSATLAAAGFNRAPLVDPDDEDDGYGKGMGSGPPSTSLEMAQHGGFGSASRASLRGGQGLPTDDEMEVGASGAPFDPYGGTAYAGGPSSTGLSGAGYIPARTASPPPEGAAPPVLAHHQAQNSYSSSGGNSGPGRASSMGHIPRYSAGSYEPLLANMGSSSGTPTPTTPGATEYLAGSREANVSGSSDNTTAPLVPPRNPKRLADTGRAGTGATGTTGTGEGYESGYETDELGSGSKPDARLDPGAALGRSKTVRDDVDYSRRVLEVRNNPSAEG